jgi:hypothetical protein
MKKKESLETVGLVEGAGMGRGGAKEAQSWCAQLGNLQDSRPSSRIRCGIASATC